MVMVEPRANMLSLLECFMVEYPHNAQISIMNGLGFSIEEVYSLLLECLGISCMNGYGCT